ncbi:hypothetical protein K443DRAFT_295021 [Laccaria amethystina LaAM-08-1]|uniref:Uncharacterized protein n=1 Tax=Laccaria amethystina LaAM-08-1 TaxID=1095629 RepID=A0A0C9XEP4_9AGAR|nr:hypothetical protein K443DRAFT_295021 [Laccaria amethystina LaAM-08-1]
MKLVGLPRTPLFWTYVERFSRNHPVLEGQSCTKFLTAKFTHLIRITLRKATPGVPKKRRACCKGNPSSGRTECGSAKYREDPTLEALYGKIATNSSV